MHDFFVWNLPLFAKRSLIEARLCLTFGKCCVDVFDPKLPKHRTHAGMARVMCADGHDFGEKTPLDLGFRYPAFVKISSRPALKLSGVKLDNDYSDVISDEKSDESTFSIAICDAIDITQPVIVMNKSIDIVPQRMHMTCKTLDAFNITPDSNISGARMSTIELSMQKQYSSTCPSYLCEKCTINHCFICHIREFNV